MNRTPHGVNIAARFPGTPTATENVLRFLERAQQALSDIVPVTQAIGA
ncbi:hypothetical protein P9209_11695 [Prescottella defluvii]|nr:hypothetical protein P9209_11695 [Prescottella defluvii]